MTTGREASSEAQKELKEGLRNIATNEWIEGQILLKLEGKTDGETEGATKAMEGLRGRGKAAQWAEIMEETDRKEKEREERLQRAYWERRREEEKEQVHGEGEKRIEQDHKERQREEQEHRDRRIREVERGRGR
ncbi:octapeptide-repeat protein T2-like [Ambystoma mexicanum]|uniref:octapeptide-repeat protein T2-like n=1 Tax=Ambystoma mexicanum TaxID=8296 RepID=UPI0037E894A8